MVKHQRDRTAPKKLTYSMTSNIRAILKSMAGGKNSKDSASHSRDGTSVSSSVKVRWRLLPCLWLPNHYDHVCDMLRNVDSSPPPGISSPGSHHPGLPQCYPQSRQAEPCHSLSLIHSWYPSWEGQTWGSNDMSWKCFENCSNKEKLSPA